MVLFSSPMTIPSEAILANCGAAICGVSREPCDAGNAYLISNSVKLRSAKSVVGIPPVRRNGGLPIIILLGLLNFDLGEMAFCLSSAAERARPTFPMRPSIKSFYCCFLRLKCSWPLPSPFQSVFKQGFTAVEMHIVKVGTAYVLPFIAIRQDLNYIFWHLTSDTYIGCQLLLN